MKTYQLGVQPGSCFGTNSKRCSPFAGQPHVTLCITEATSHVVLAVLKVVFVTGMSRWSGRACGGGGLCSSGSSHSSYSSGSSTYTAAPAAARESTGSLQTAQWRRSSPWPGGDPESPAKWGSQPGSNKSCDDSVLFTLCLNMSTQRSKFKVTAWLYMDGQQIYWSTSGHNFSQRRRAFCQLKKFFREG